VSPHPVRSLVLATGAAAMLLLVCAQAGAAAPVPKPGDTLSTARSSTSASDTKAAPAAPATKTKTTVVTSGSSGSSGTSWWTLLVTGLVGLALGGAGCYLLLRSSPRHRTGSAPAAAAAATSGGSPPASWPASAPSPPRPPASDSRFQPLVDAVIATRDMVDPTSVIARRLGAALAEGGVVELAPVGQRFDPAQHHAVETAPTLDPARADQIAEIQRVGYREAHRLIRLPEVIVFRLEQSR
jgi:hypothetical protein